MSGGIYLHGQEVTAREELLHDRFDACLTALREDGRISEARHTEALRAFTKALLDGRVPNCIHEAWLALEAAVERHAESFSD